MPDEHAPLYRFRLALFYSATRLCLSFSIKAFCFMLLTSINYINFPYNYCWKILSFHFSRRKSSKRPRTLMQPWVLVKSLMSKTCFSIKFLNHFFLWNYNKSKIWKGYERKMLNEFFSFIIKKKGCFLNFRSAIHCVLDGEENLIFLIEFCTVNSINMKVHCKVATRN